MVDTASWGEGSEEFKWVEDKKVEKIMIQRIVEPT
jgi:hypothetical protein